MNENDFEDYLRQAQELSAVAVQKDSSQDLLEWIQFQQENCQNSEQFQEFLKAEYALYSEQPEMALKYYLNAKSIPHFQFFCYRASAMIAKKRTDFDKALRFARKAIRLLPNDPLTQSILDDMPVNHSDSAPLQVSLGESELKELDHILSCSQESSESCQNSTDFTVINLSENINKPIHNAFEQQIYQQSTPAQSALTSSGEYKHSQTLNLRQEVAMLPLDETNTISALQDQSQNFGSWEEETEKALESRIDSFQRSRAEQLSQYIQQAKRRTALPDHALWIFNGWADSSRETMSTPYSLLTQQARKPSSGFFLRWNGKGIVINPGKNFLQQFHQKGLHIKDIDYVIVTQSQPDTFADIKEIYDLNYQLNKVSSDLQIIDYYLNQTAHLQLTSILKPNFKQERNAVHALELFLDSPDVEKIEICPGVQLNYFPTSSQESLFPRQNSKEDRSRQSTSSLGIRFDLRPSNSAAEKSLLRIGYVSGTHWTPLLGHHLGPCDLLLAGFGNTNSSDFGKLNYNEECLGYFGTYSLLEEVNPKLMVCCEFDGREGDIRLEVVRKLRNECAHTNGSNHTNAILPSDNGLFVALNEMRVRCDVSHQLVDPSQLKVVKSNQAFGRLFYLAPSCQL